MVGEVEPAAGAVKVEEAQHLAQRLLSLPEAQRGRICSQPNCICQVNNGGREQQKVLL